MNVSKVKAAAKRKSMMESALKVFKKKDKEKLTEQEAVRKIEAWYQRILIKRRTKMEILERFKKARVIPSNTVKPKTNQIISLQPV